MKDLFNEVIDLLRKRAQSDRLEMRQRRKLEEACARLEMVAGSYGPIREQNDELLDTDPLSPERMFTDEVFLAQLRKDAKTDPEMREFLDIVEGRVQPISTARGSGYTMTDMSDVDPDRAEKLRQLQAATEQLYSSLWIVKGAVSYIGELKNFDPKGVRNVRNHLMEHTDKGGATIFSFGLSSNGPVLRPIRPTGATAPNDAGLDKNLEQFLKGIKVRLPPA